MKAMSIDAPSYIDDEAVIQRALTILQSRLQVGVAMTSPDVVKNYLTVRAAAHPDHEVFTVMFLDAQHGVLDTQDMFRGTTTQTSVYPREVAKVCLQLNAAAVILAHNHPSGKLEPSSADIQLTAKLKSTLELVDVRVLDHIITAGGQALSMAEKGLV